MSTVGGRTELVDALGDVLSYGIPGDGAACRVRAQVPSRRAGHDRQLGFGDHVGPAEGQPPGVRQHDLLEGPVTADGALPTIIGNPLLPAGG